MWLIITLLALVAAITLFVALEKHRKRYKLGLLVLMLTGTFLMVLVDHTIAFIKEGTFIETTTDGLIKSGTLLGVAMVLTVVFVWIIAIGTSEATRPGTQPTVTRGKTIPKHA